MKTLKLLLLITLLPVTLLAQAKKDTSKAAQIRKQFEQTLLKGKDAEAVNLKAQTTALANEQFKTMIAQEKQNQLEIQDAAFDVHHRQRSFDFQYTASVIIFILVIVIVFAGLVFSAIQFNFSLRQMKLHDKLLDTVQNAQAAPLADQLKTDLEFSKDGIKVNSSVLGVIILVFSVAFFYLYLIYVYPIKYITPEDAAKITGTAPVTINAKDTVIKPKPPAAPVPGPAK